GVDGRAARISEGCRRVPPLRHGVDHSGGPPHNDPLPARAEGSDHRYLVVGHPPHLWGGSRGGGWCTWLPRLPGHPPHWWGWSRGGGGVLATPRKAYSRVL